MGKLKKPIDVREVTSKVVKDYQRDKEYQANKRIIAFRERQKKYSQSRSGRFASLLQRGMKFARSPTRALYSRQIEPQPLFQSNSRTIKGITRAGRGRPVGTLDKRYAAYGGVYGYRKYLASQLRIQRMEALRRATVTPQQQQILAQIEARRNYQAQNPENKVIPDTTGAVPMSSIMMEADRYSRLVD
jgi:hypothetical protein